MSKVHLKPGVVAKPPLLIGQFLRAFIWMDRSLQLSLEALGWPPVTRAESQIMLLVDAGICRPAEISRSLGLTRQAINQTLKLLADKNLIFLEDDPEDARCKCVRFDKGGEAMRRDALEILHRLEDELAGKLEGRSLASIRSIDDDTLGPPKLVKLKKK